MNFAVHRVVSIAYPGIPDPDISTQRLEKVNPLNVLQ